MTTILRDCALVIMLWVLVGTPTHLAYEQSIDPCATGETPCDPNRGWMRGSVEKYCGRKEHLNLIREANPGKMIQACACQHQCQPDDPYATETNNLKWDARCAARCSVTNCSCPDPCDENGGAQ